VTTREKLAKNPEQFLQLLRALIKAENFLKENSAEAQSLLEKWLRLEAGDLDDFFATTSFRVSLDVPQMKQWMGEELEWLRLQRPDSSLPADLSPFVDSSLLKSIDPSRVRE